MLQAHPLLVPDHSPSCCQVWSLGLLATIASEGSARSSWHVHRVTIDTIPVDTQPDPSCNLNQASWLPVASGTPVLHRCALVTQGGGVTIVVAFIHNSLALEVQPQPRPWHRSPSGCHTCPFLSSSLGLSLSLPGCGGWRCGTRCLLRRAGPPQGQPRGGVPLTLALLLILVLASTPC